MDGLLFINKPKGWTSFDVVAKVKGLLKQAGVIKPKVGHTGTLDPLATGLLILTLGTYCKRVPELIRHDKSYEVSLVLGKTSTTDDTEGEITTVNEIRPTLNQVNKALQSFKGDIQQVPPIYSAIKVRGKRAYALARQGKTVQLEPRAVRINQISNIHYTYPELKFVADVSSGTYIRSMARDLGQKLGTGAYLRDLMRTQIGQYSLKDAHDVQELDPKTIANNIIDKFA